MIRNVLIVEDVSPTRNWLHQVVQSAFPEASCTEASTLRAGRAALDVAHDMALIDLGLPDGSGLDLIREIRQRHPATTAIVTTVMADDATVVAALSAGAEGYLLKENPAEVLIHQLRQHNLGIPALSPAIARRIMEHFRFTGPAAPEGQRLTQREEDVLRLIGRGLRNAEVAHDLGLAESTVASYIKVIYRKLGISSRAEAAWQAARLGLNAEK